MTIEASWREGIRRESVGLEAVRSGVYTGGSLPCLRLRALALWDSL